MLNVELWDREVRKSLMPGKSKISRERYMAALEYGVRLFGANQVSSQVLIGLEPIDSTLAAIDAIADTGAIPLPTVFRLLRNTPLVDRVPPSVEEVLRVFEHAVEAIHARGMLFDKTRAGCALCGACSAHR